MGIPAQGAMQEIQFAYLHRSNPLTVVSLNFLLGYFELR